MLKAKFYFFLFIVIVKYQFIQAQDISLNCSNTDPFDQPCFNILVDTDGNGTKEFVASTSTPNSGIVEICVNTEIEVSLCSGCGNISYVYEPIPDVEPEDQPDRTSSTTHIYTQPGTYSIMQIGSCDGTGCTITYIDIIRVLETPEPLVNLSLCQNRSISLEIPDTAPENPYDEYIIDWGDSSPLQTVSSSSANNIQHTYPTSSTFTILVRGNYLGVACDDENYPQATLQVTPILTLTPPTVNSLTTTVLDNTNGSISLNFDASNNFDYEVFQQVNGGSFSKVQDITGLNGNTTANFENLNTSDDSHCYRIDALDKCGNRVQSESFYCNLRLNVMSVVGGDRQIQVNWSTYPNTLPIGIFQQYILYRNNQPIITISDINEISYLDENIACNEEYCYEVRAVLTDASLGVSFISISNEECAVGASEASPPIIPVLNSTVETSRSIRLFWTVANDPKITTYQVKRNGQEVIAQSTQQSAIDADLALNQQYCYEVAYTNECGQGTDFAFQTCPVFLQITDPNSIRPELIWTAYENVENSFAGYIIEKLDENGNVYSESNLLSRFVTNFIDEDARTDRQIISYRIKVVIDVTNEIFSYSNIVEVRQDFKLFFPNAFTPDGDGLNDIFQPKGLFMKDFKMDIYNRLGELVFTSSNTENGWDGNFKGKPATQDVYIYIVNMEDFKGVKFQGKGTFTLIRKR